MYETGDSIFEVDELEYSITRDPETGTERTYYPLDIFQYQFLPPTQEEKNKGAIIKLSVVVLGAKIRERRKERVRVDNILFVARRKNLATLADYKDVDVIYPDLSEVDPVQIERFKDRVEQSLYVSTYLKDPEVRKSLNISFPSKDIF